MCDTPPDFSPGDATPLAPAADPPVPSPTTVHSSPAMVADSVPAAGVAPTTPPWLLGPDTPVPPACPSANACPVCMCDVHTSGQGPEMPFAWPNCQHRRHRLPGSLGRQRAALALPILSGAVAAASSGTVPTGVPCAWSGDAKPGAGARHYVGQPPANSGSAPTSSCVASLLPAHLPCRLGPSRVAGSVAGTARPPYALGARTPPGG